jgi:hypothetical protein
MIRVTVLNARLTPDARTLGIADVELDGAVTVRGVRLVEAWSDGRPFAVAPLRHDDASRPVLSWSDSVGWQIAAAIRAALGDSAAVSEGEAAA